MRRRMVAGFVGWALALLVVASVSAFTLADGSSGWSTMTTYYSSATGVYANARTYISGGKTNWTLKATSILNGVGGYTATGVGTNGYVSVNSPGGVCYPRPCTMTFVSTHTWDGTWGGIRRHYENGNIQRITLR